MAYPWQNLSPTDIYQVEDHASLDASSLKVLSFFYQPLIQADAYRLYLFLAQQKTGQAYLHADLLNALNIGLADFYEARIRLEGAGLLKTYLHSEDTYIYQLLPSLSASEFLADDLLRMSVKDLLGENTLAKLAQEFELEDLDKSDYEELTRSYTDVYSLKGQADPFAKGQRKADQAQAKAKGPVLEPEELDFDYSLLRDLVSQQFVKSSELGQPAMQSLVYSIHSLYGFDEKDLAQLILQATDVRTGQVDAKALEKLAQESFQSLQAKPQAPSEEEEPRPSPSSENLSQEEQALVQASRDLPPMQFLHSVKKQKGGFVTDEEGWLVKNLTQQSGLKTEVINILIHYVLVQQNNPTLAKTYTNTIANDWAQKKVQSSEQAIQEVKDLVAKTKRKQAQKRTYGKGRRVEKLPQWAKEGAGQKTDQSLENKAKPDSDQEKQDQAVDFDGWLDEIRKHRKE